MNLLETTPGANRAVGRRIALALTLLSSGFAALSQASEIGIRGTAFTLNGAVTYPGRLVEGRLMNSRMANAIFDDDNPATVAAWGYPDTGVWDANRNTREFIAALPSYAASGLKAITVGMQGGNPFQLGVAAHPWIVSAFTPDGALKPAWLTRADKVIRAADQHGLVVILQYFYQHQEDRFVSNGAVLAAADNMTAWVLRQGYKNVLIEINNEATNDYSKPSLKLDNVHALIARVQTRSSNRLKVSTSFRGGVIPPDAVIRQCDYITLHGNHQTASQIASLIASIKATPAYQAAPKPILFNEDSTAVDNLNAAVANGASWGYHDGGLRNYRNGFQYLPVNWTINTPVKRAFFDRVAMLAGMRSAGPPILPQSDVPTSDLAVVTVDTPDPTAVGANLTYTARVINRGPDAATGVTFTDTLPPTATVRVATAGCVPSFGVVVCALGTLASGGSVPVGITVAPTASGTISNVAQASGNEHDPNSANNAQTTVNTASALACNRNGRR